MTVTAPLPRATTPARLHRATLSNGLRVLLAPAPDAPVVAVSVHVDVGFRSEPEHRAGFAHLFEHLMFQGSESVPAPGHSQQMYGCGAIVNGSTHPDYTDYFEVMPAAALDRALFLEADRLRAPRLTGESLRTQVSVVQEEIRLNVTSRPYGGFPWILVPPVLYGTFANTHDGYGDVSGLGQATPEDAAAFFDTYYAPGNVLLTVAGALDVERTLAMVERHFGDIPARPVPRRPSFAEPPPDGDRHRTVRDAAAPLPALALGYRLPDPASDPDGYLAQALLGSVLTDGRASRLQRRLVHGEDAHAAAGVRATAVSASCGLFGIPFDARDPDTFTITAVHPADVDPQRVVAAVDDELARVAEGAPLAPDELAHVAARWSASLHQKQDQQLGRLLALGSRELLHGRAELVGELPERVAALTPTDVAAAAARLREQGRAVLLVEPGRSTAGPTTGSTAPTAPAAPPRAHPTGRRSAERIGRTAVGPRRPPAVEATTTSPDLAAAERVLPTGLRVVAVTRRSVPMVELRLRIPFADPGLRHGAGTGSVHRARAELLAATLCHGTATRDRLALDAELARVGADIGVTVDPERLWVSVSGLAGGLPTLLALLADVLTGATYVDDDVQRERHRLVERTTLGRAQPRTIAREALQRCRHGDHPAAHEVARPADLATVEPDQVRHLHRAAVVPTGSTLVLVGDVDPDGALDAVATALASWDAPGVAAELAAPPVVRPSGTVLVDRPGAVQSQLRLAAPVVGRSDARYAAVQLANLCLGGYGSSRLHGNLREDKGYTYHAASRLEHTPYGASLLIDTDVTREVTGAALREIHHELERLVAEPPDRAEVDAARRFAVGTLLISSDSQPGVAALLAALAEEGLDATWLRDHPRRLLAVTPAQVAAVAAEFLVPAAFTEVVVGDGALVAPQLAAHG